MTKLYLTRWLHEVPLAVRGHKFRVECVGAHIRPEA